MITVRFVAIVGFLSVCGMIAACRSTDRPQFGEEDFPDLRILGKSADDLAHPVVKEKSDATADGGLEIAIHPYGAENEDRIIVMIHGVLTDHRVWRYVIGDLGGEHEIWAIDLPGCGDSDKPNPVTASRDAYSPTWMAKHVMSALRKRLAERDSETRVTIVAHSLGGGVALRMLGAPEIASDFPDVLERIDGAVLMAPLEFGLTPISSSFEELANVTDVKATAAIVAGVLRKEVADAIYGSAFEPDRVPTEEVERTVEILEDPERRHPMRYMLRRAIPRNEDGSPNREGVRRLKADYRNIKKPCLLLWGELDDAISPNSGYVLDKHIPTSQLRLLTDTMHSLQIEQPKRCAAQILGFLDSDPQDWDPTPQTLLRNRAPRGERENSATRKKEEISRRRSEPLKTAPSSVSVIRGQTVPRSGARYVSDSLRMVPGVEVVRTSSTESGIAFRGYADDPLAAQGTLGLVDGRQVYNQFLGNVQWDQLAVRLEDIDQIEVLSGPGSFIHGPNAMHGVVHIKTKSPLQYDDDFASVIAHIGSYSSRVAGATVVNRTHLTGFKISAQWDDIGQFGNERGDTRNKGFADAAFEMQLDGDPNHVFGFSGGFSQQLFDVLLPALEAIPSTIAANKSRDLYAKADYRKGDPDALAFNAQFSWNGFDGDSNPEQFYERFTVDLDTLYIDGRLTWAASRHFVTGGAGFRYSTFDTVDSDVSNGSHSVNEFWLFAQDEWKVTDSLFRTFGARVDHHSETGTRISPRLAAVWEFVDNNYFRASAGRGFRNPSLRELWFNMPITGVPGLPTVTLTGNLDLNPESLTSFELGYFGAWGPLVDTQRGTVIVVGPTGESHQYEAGVKLFYNLVDDLVLFESDPADPLRVMPVNQDNEEVFGFELEGRYMLRESFSAFANYSYSLRRNRDSEEESRVTRQNTVNAGLSYTGSRWNAMLWANFKGSTELDDIALDSYVLVNGSVSYNFPIASGTTGSAFIRFFNLLNDKHKEHPNGDEYGLILTSGIEIDW